MKKLDLSNIQTDCVKCTVLNIDNAILIENNDPKILKKVKNFEFEEGVTVLNATMEEFKDLENYKNLKSIQEETDFLLIVIAGHQIEQIKISTFKNIIEKIRAEKLPLILDHSEYFKSTDKYKEISNYIVVKDEESIENSIIGLTEYSYSKNQMIGLDYRDLMDFFKDCGRIIVSRYKGAKKNLNLLKLVEDFKKIGINGLYFPIKSGFDYSFAEVSQVTEELKRYFNINNSNVMYTLVCDEEYPLESIDIIIYGVEKSQNILEDGMGIELNLPDWIRVNRKVENGEITEEKIQN